MVPLIPRLPRYNTIIVVSMLIEEHSNDVGLPSELSEGKRLLHLVESDSR